MSKFISFLITALIFGLPSLFISATACELPFQLIKKGSTNIHNEEYYENTTVLKKAVATVNLDISCKTGSLTIKENSEIIFLESGSIKELTVANSGFIKQNNRIFNLSEGSIVNVNESNTTKIASLEGIALSQIVLENMDVQATSFANFYDNGNLKETELASGSNLTYLGVQHLVDEGDEIIISEKGYALPEADSAILGDWQLQPKDGDLIIRIDKGELGNYQAFYLKGASNFIDSKINISQLILPISDEFYPDDKYITKISLIGTKVVPNPDDSTKTTTITIKIPATINVQDDKLTLKLSESKTFILDNHGFFKEKWMSSKILFWSFLSLIMGLVVFFFTLRLITKKLGSTEVDHRYSEHTLIGGGTLFGLVLWLLFFAVCTYFVYDLLILKLVGIGGITDFFHYWML